MVREHGPADLLSVQRVASEHCGPVQILEIRSSAAKNTETTMTPENVRKLHVLSRQLTEYLMSAALCAKEIGEITQDPGNDGHSGNGHNGKHSVPRPLLDEATLSVIWRDHPLYLGYTKEFRLLAHLARRANQYVMHVDLLEDVWDDDFADAALLRASIQRLRTKLRRGGMADLAEAVIGCKGHYILDLAAARVTEKSS